MGGDANDQGTEVRFTGISPWEEKGHAPQDQYGLTLNYYHGDYYPIGTGKTGFANTESGYSSSRWDTAAKNLYNGNIRAITIALSQLDTARPVAYSYHYDQLNRLRRTDMYKGYSSGAWTSTAPFADYKERYSYDENGNILTLLRNGYSGNANGVMMDSLHYKYTSGTNKLDHVNDSVGASAYTVDIDNQNGGNYKYDKIGELVRDSLEGIDSIKWTVYGKVRKIYKHNGDSIIFAYDALGNRISKKIAHGTKTICEYYIRDAQGNILTTYVKDSAGNVKIDEAMLYGSSRLGSYSYGKYLYYASTPATIPLREWMPVITSGVVQQTGFGELYYGKKNYELTNHLGNVLGTVSDRTKRVVNLLGGYTAVTAYEKIQQDYYSFGMLQPNRSFADNARYKFGFNGKIKDNEIEGNGNNYDYGFRMYDPRIGRWLSIDKSFKDYAPISPYAFALNTPIKLKDAEGKVVVDGEGHPVLISITQDKNGKYVVAYEFQEGTSQETIDDFFEKASPIIQAMSTTEVGRKNIEAMNESHNAITLELVKGKKGYLDTKTQKIVDEPNENTIEEVGVTQVTHLNGPGELPDVKITIFKKMVEMESEPTYLSGIVVDDEAIPLGKFSYEENLGGTGVHESTHATDINSNSNVRPRPNPGGEEKLPYKNELKYYKELDKSKSQKRTYCYPPEKN